MAHQSSKNSFNHHEIYKTYPPNPLISVLESFALSQQKSEYLLLTLERLLKKALLLV